MIPVLLYGNMVKTLTCEWWIYSVRAVDDPFSLFIFSFQGLDIIGVQTVINFACPRDLTR